MSEVACNLAIYKELLDFAKWALASGATLLVCYWIFRG